MRLPVLLAALALVTVALPLALPHASAAPCVTYSAFGLMPKTQTCVHPDDVPGCPVSSQSWTSWGTYYFCYGTDSFVWTGPPPVALP